MADSPPPPQTLPTLHLEDTTVDEIGGESSTDALSEAVERSSGFSVGSIPPRLNPSSANKIHPSPRRTTPPENGSAVLPLVSPKGSPHRAHKSLGHFQALDGRKSAKFLMTVPTAPMSEPTKPVLPHKISADKTRRRMAEQKPSVRERLPMVRGLETEKKAAKNTADEAVGAFKKLGTKGAWNLGSNCIVRVGNKGLTKVESKKSSRDLRNECDILTDYLMALAKPSENEVNGWEEKPLLDVAKWYHKNWVRVYEEDYGASGGLAKNYWVQRWVEEEEDPDNGKCKVWRTPDNHVFHHMQPRVREFFDLGGYRAFPDVVAIEVQVRELLEVDCARGIFRVGFILSLRWYKDRKNERVYARSIPYITFDHIDLGDSPIGVPEDASSLDSDMHTGMATLRKDGPHGGDPPGVLYHSMRIQATFRDETDDLTLFPFDQQTLSMGMRLWGSTMRGSPDEHRVLLPINIAMQLEQEHPEWITMSAECESHRPRGKRQDLEITMHIRRRAAFFIINVAVIIFLLTSMCFAVFNQSNDVEEYGDRTQTTLTLLLTTVAYKFFVNDMFPKISYLTVMDMYIFAGLVTSMCIFGLNTLTICRDYPDGCDKQREMELAGLGIIGVFWMGWNGYFVYKSVDYVKTIHWTESTKVAYSKTKKKFKKKAKMVKSLYKKARENERDFIEPQCTVRKRRSYAAERFLQREEWEIKNGRKLDQSDRRGLHPNISKSQPSTTCKISRERQYRGSVVVPVADDTGIPQLLRRAALRSEEGLLAPVLEDAKLTGDMLRDLYKNGKGADALNSLLEESGVTEPSHRVSIIGALDEDGTRMERLITNLIGNSLPANHPSRKGVTSLFLVLQGAPSYLWQEDLKCEDECIDRVDFLRKIDNQLATFQNSATVSFRQLRSMANCIFTRLLLTTPLLGRAEYIYSNREIAYTREYDGVEHELTWPTQTWTGYLIRTEGTKWAMEAEGSVLAIEVGTNKMKAGYVAVVRDAKNHKLQMVCHPISNTDVASDMTRISKLFTKSVLFAHPYMVTDSTMAHRPMLKQVLTKFDMLKNRKLDSNSLFNPNKDLLGLYNCAYESHRTQDGFDGIPFVVGGDECEISVARVIKAVERYLPREIGFISKALEALIPQYESDREKFARHKIVLVRSKDIGNEDYGYVVRSADCLPKPDSKLHEYMNMEKIDFAYILLSYAMLSNEAQKTQTDHLVEVCDVLTAEWIIPTLKLTRAQQCADMSPEKTHAYVKRIMLFGTAELHERVIDLEKYCGLLSTEHLGAVADFCCELLRLRDPNPEGSGDRAPYKLTFEVLSPDDQAECNNEAVKQAICCISPTTPVMEGFRRSVLDDDHHESFGSVSWNDLGISTGANFQGSCQGIVGRDLFTLPVGLVSVMTALLFEAQLQNSNSLSSRELTIESDCLRRQLATMKSGGDAPPLQFIDVKKAVALVQQDVSRSLRQLNAELQPFHPAVTGPHNNYDNDKAREEASKWMVTHS